MTEYLDGEHELVGILYLEEGEYLEGGVEVCGDAVVHHNKLSLRRCDLEDPVHSEVLVVNRLVEVAVIQYHSPREVTVRHLEIFVEC